MPDIVELTEETVAVRVLEDGDVEVIGLGSAAVPPAEGTVTSVNGQDGVVVLDAADVGAIDDSVDVIIEGDARLTNARTPTAHAASHADGGADEIGVDASQVVSGTLDIARIPAAVATNAEVTTEVGVEAAARAAADALLIPLTQKGAAAGVATLDGGGLIPTTQLPGLAISSTFVVASQAAMLALAAQTGDVAVRTDQNKTYILEGTDPTVLADWQELLTPTDSVTSVEGRTGAVSVADLYDAAGAAAAAQAAAATDATTKANAAQAAAATDATTKANAAQAAAEATAAAALAAHKLEVISTKTADYTLVVADGFTTIQGDSATAKTLTVPTNAAQPIPVGTQIKFRNINTGLWKVIAASGVTLPRAAADGDDIGYELYLGDEITFVKLATDTWAAAPVYGGVTPELWIVGLDSMPFTVQPETWTTLTWNTPAIERGGEMWDAGSPTLVGTSKGGQKSITIINIPFAAHPIGVRQARIWTSSAAERMDHVSTNLERQIVKLTSYGPTVPNVATQRVDVWHNAGVPLDIVTDSFNGPQWMQFAVA